MQNIATENNLSETAFVAIRGRGKFDIRWFTPTTEVRLCGHATLAAAHVLYRSGGQELKKMRFKTREAGTITVTPLAVGGYSLDFSVDKYKKIKSSKEIRGALGGLAPEAIYRGTDDIVAVVKNEEQVANIQPNLHIVSQLKNRGLIVTAPGDEVDFVSRCFYPAFGIDEDPVTGSAHTLLTPIWAERLGKKKLRARQISSRGGELGCQLRGEKVRLIGSAVTYLAGQIYLNKI